MTYVISNPISSCKIILAHFLSDGLVREIRYHDNNGISIAFWYNSDLCHNGSTVAVLFLSPDKKYAHNKCKNIYFVPMFLASLVVKRGQTRPQLAICSTAYPNKSCKVTKGVSILTWSLLTRIMLRNSSLISRGKKVKQGTIFHEQKMLTYLLSQNIPKD